MRDKVFFSGLVGALLGAVLVYGVSQRPQALAFDQGAIFGAGYHQCTGLLPSGGLRAYVWRTQPRLETCEDLTRLRAWEEQGAAAWSASHGQ